IADPVSLYPCLPSLHMQLSTVEHSHAEENQMVDMGWQHFRGQALGCMIGVLLLGCGQGSTQRDGFREEKQALEEDTEAPSASTASEAVEAVVESDGPTSTAVTVAWHDQNDSKVSSQFPVLVTNTSPVV